jgi:hypothetical protein
VKLLQAVGRGQPTKVAGAVDEVDSLLDVKAIHRRVVAAHLDTVGVQVGRDDLGAHAELGEGDRVPSDSAEAVDDDAFRGHLFCNVLGEGLRCCLVPALSVDPNPVVVPREQLVPTRPPFEGLGVGSRVKAPRANLLGEVR